MKLSIKEVCRFHKLQRNAEREVGGILGVRENGSVTIRTAELGDANGVSPEGKFNRDVMWHLHTVRNGNASPPSPGDMRSTLALSLLGHSRADVLFTNEGIYVFNPSRGLLGHMHSAKFADVTALEETLRKAYSMIARSQTLTVDQQRTLIIDFYKKIGFDIVFVPWEEAEREGVEIPSSR